VTDYVEAPIDNWIAGFDGRVLEIFTGYREGSTRYHVSLLVDLKIEGNTLAASFQRREGGMWPFNEDQRPQVEALVAAVNAARGV
jgi:hypothetical protein